MNKRKLLTLALTVCMIAILAIGGSLAYLSDTDTKTNVFTHGDVTIDLWENFKDNSKLLPATGSAQDGTLQNGVKKEVFVTNTGSEDAYVRVHIAIPQILDNGDPTFDAGQNVLHFNYNDESIGEGKWDWSKSTGAPYEGEWNFYTTQIHGIWYNVYVVTYGEALAGTSNTDPNASKVTVDAMHQVYLDSKVTNDDLKAIDKVLGSEWHIHVIAEGTQAEGFNDAYEALNAAFGVPGKYTVDWTASTIGGAPGTEKDQLKK